MELLITKPNWSYIEQNEQKPFKRNLKRHFALLKKFFPISLLIIISACFPSCGGKENKPPEEIKANAVVQKKPGSTYQDTLRVETPAAVFYFPDSLQFSNIRSINDSSVFESMNHDCEYQMRNARNLIRKNWPSLTIMNTVKARWLQFTQADQSFSYIDLDQQNDMCGLFLFDPKKKPLRADMMNLETELDNYFSNYKQ